MPRQNSITRRSWLGLAAVVPALAQTGEPMPDLGPRLNALWHQATSRSLPEAVLVSSIAYAALPPLRGWRDERFLHAYIAWADRPEAVGVRNDILNADLGPYDWILLRHDHRGVISQTLHSPDPIGYTLFRPGAGPQPIEVKFSINDRYHGGVPVYGLSSKPLPTIDTILAAGPEIVTLYGTGFEGNNFEIASETGAGTILYSSLTQINARVPSLDRVRLIIDGSPTPWVPVTKPVPVKTRSAKQ